MKLGPLRSTLTYSFLWIAAALTLSVNCPAQAQSVEGFKTWLKTLRPEAEALGISTRTFDGVTSTLKPDFSIPDLDLPGKPKVDNQGQAEFTRTAREYISKPYIVNLASQGQQFYREHKKAIDAIERRTGVDRYIIVAIWGRETAYGFHKLPHDAITVLATLGYTGRRKDMFKDEFLYALKMLDDGIPRSDMRSSWAGAVGLTQFMPSEFYKHAADGDDDGKIDIWRSIPDALASAARQLEGKGWVRGQRWGYEVIVGEGSNCSLEGPPGTRTIAEWVKLGFRRSNGKPFNETQLAEPAYLMMPAGAHGPAFLTPENWQVIRRYNTSDLYALFVGHLADRIAGGGDFDTPWGNSQQPKTITVHDIQEGLQALGYPMDKLDGKIGSNTRRQIGIYQVSSGLRADCWPSDKLLAHIRQTVSAKQ